MQYRMTPWPWLLNGTWLDRILKSEKGMKQALIFDGQNVLLHHKMAELDLFIASMEDIKI